MTLKRYIPGAILLMLIWTINIPAQEEGIGFEEQPNLIEEENLEPGTTAWQIPKGEEAFDREIEGYSSKPSVDIGEKIQFHVSVKNSRTFRIDIYRMGWYGGDGGRLMASLTNLQGIDQTMPTADHTTGLMECNWVMPSTGPYEWEVPSVSRNSGAYIAKLTVNVPGVGDKRSYISFIVRDDSRISAYLFQTSVTTYQAYNFWPRDVPVTATSTVWHQGKSLYGSPLSWGPVIPEGNPNGNQARKVSFNRPYAMDQLSIYPTAGQFFTHGEYSMVRFMEKKKMDVTYTTDVDTDSANALSGPLGPGMHQVFLSVGHDEYWSWRMRDNIEKARNRTNAPLNIGWFGANDVHWQIRFENSSAGSSPASAEKRTIVAYKHLATSGTAAWRDPQFVPQGSGWSPNNYLTTNHWRDNNADILGPRCPGEPTVPDCYKPDEDELVGVMTKIEPAGAVTGRGDFSFLTSCPAFVKRGVNNTAFPIYNLVGYEADEIFNMYTSSGSAHPRLFYQIGNSLLYQDGNPTLNSTASHAVYYELTGNGARVFAAGTVFWGWGVDPFGEPAGPNYSGPNFLEHPATYDTRVEKMSENILLCLRDGGTACNIE